MASYATFPLRITRDEFLAYYAGAKRIVRVQALEGFSIQFRAEHLRPWVTHDGISGIFQIEFDDSRRFIRLKKIDGMNGSSGGGQGGSGSHGGPRGGRPRGGFSTEI